MLHALLLPLVAGLLVGVNAYNAPALKARLAERANDPRRVPLEFAILTLGVMALLALVSWRFAAFISGRLTNSLLFLGFFALAAAFYTLRPSSPREPDPVPTGWRWLTRQAGDIAYLCGPAWILATFLAMRQLTLARFLLPYAAAATGIVLTTILWTTRYAHALPTGPKRPDGTRPRAILVLSLAYATSALLMLTANLKLI